MGKNEGQDAIEQLKEWQEHQYNPAHWYNRVWLGFPQKPSWKMWLWELVQFVLTLVGLIAFSVEYIVNQNKYILLAVILMAAFCLVFGLRMRYFMPKGGNARASQISSHHNDDEKKQPKRRKDYH